MWKMTNQEIKIKLIESFIQEFDPEARIDKTTTETDITEFSTRIEYQDSKGNWHDAQLNCEAIRIYKHTEEDASHQTHGDPFGRGEWVGGNVKIESVDLGDIAVYLNNERGLINITQEEIDLFRKQNQ